MSDTDCWIVDAVRTPTGKRNGSLSGYHPTELGAHVVDSLFERLGIAPDNLPIDDLFLGCVSQVGAQAGNLARGVVLASSLPTSVPGMTVDRQCGSSLQALQLATHQVWATGGAVLAGGVEIMSAVPLGSQYDFGVTSALTNPKPRPAKPVSALAAKPSAGAVTGPKSHSAVPLAGPAALARFPLGTPLPAAVMLRFPAPCPSGLPRLPLLAHAHPFSIAARFPHAALAQDRLPADTPLAAPATPAGTAWFYNYNEACPYTYLPHAASQALLPPAHAYPADSALPAQVPCCGPHLLPPGPAHSQFVGAEMIARKYGLCHCSLLEYARLSFHRALLAQQRGAFDGELAPLPKRNKADARPPQSDAATVLGLTYGPDAPAPAQCRVGPYSPCTCDRCAPRARALAPVLDSGALLLADETVRPVPTQAKLLSMRPIPPSTWITAPLASQISDGASMALLVSTDVLKRLADDASRPVRPLGRVVATCAVAGDPVCMLDQVPGAIRRVVQLANDRLAREHSARETPFMPLTPGDARIYYEINEAFASVPLVAARVLGIQPDRLNVWGGAIALGHPLGATGAKLIATACRAARKLGCPYAVVSVCEGGGMANAMLVEVQDPEMMASL